MMRRGLLIGGAVSLAFALAGCGGSSERAAQTAPAPAGPWSAPLELPAPAPPAGAPLALLADGRAISVWTERGPGRGRVLAAERDREGRWGPGAPIVDTSPFIAWGASVVVDHAGVATAVWVLNDKPQGAIFGFVQASRRSADGRWSAPVTLSRGTNGLIAPLVAVQDDGRIVVVWSGSERRNGSYLAQVRSASRSPAGRWSFSTVAGPGPDPVSGQGALAAVPGGRHVRVVWLALSRRGHQGGVFSSARDRSGRWSAPARVSSGGEEPNDLRVATGADGTMVAAWTGEGRSVPVRLALRRPDGDWSPPRTVSLPGGYNREPEVVVGPGGGALVTLERWKGGATPSLLQALRIDRDGRASRPATLARRAVPAALGAGGRMPLPWQAAPALRADGRALVAWPRLGQGGSGGARPAQEIVGRIAERGGPWRPAEQIATFATPPPSVALSSGSDARGRFVVRWDEPTSATASVSRASERTP